MVKIFKNGIDTKWILLIIGIIISIGYASAVNPFISDTLTSQFGGMNVTSLNSSGNIRTDTNIAAGGALQTPNSRTTTISTQGANSEIVLSHVNGTFSFMTAGGIGDASMYLMRNTTNFMEYIANSNTVTYSSLFVLPSISAATPDSDWAICRNPTTKEIKVNTGLTSCASSSEKVKHNIKTINQENLPDNFMKVRPIKFVYNADKTDREKVGFSAEELALIYPEVVATNYGGNGTFIKFIIDSTNPNKAIGALYSDGIIAEIVGVNYEFYTAILTYKLQEQTIVNINQQNDINTLKYEVELLKGNTSAVAPTLISTTTPITTTPWWKFW